MTNSMRRRSPAGSATTSSARSPAPPILPGVSGLPCSVSS
jgi:hypothetical protein